MALLNERGGESGSKPSLIRCETKAGSLCYLAASLSYRQIPQQGFDAQRVRRQDAYATLLRTRSRANLQRL